MIAHTVPHEPPMVEILNEEAELLKRSPEMEVIQILCIR